MGSSVTIKGGSSELGEGNVGRKGEIKNLSFTFFSLLLPPTLSSSFSLYRLKGKNVCINIHIFKSEERRREVNGEIKIKV